MILGIPLWTLASLHAVLGLTGLVAGCLMLVAMMGSHAAPRIAALFLSTTAIVAATGLLLPAPPAVPSAGPGHALAVACLIVLVPTALAHYVHHFAGAWRGIYVAGSTALLLLNTFTAARQLVKRIEFFDPLLGTPIEATLYTLVLIGPLALGALAAAYFRPS